MAGECGEYELLFTVPPEQEQEMLRAAREQKVKLHMIGSITGPGKATVVSGKHCLSLGDFTLSARDYNDHGEYVTMLTRYLMSKKQ